MLAAGLWLIGRIARVAPGNPALLRPALALALMLLAQVALGAAVVWHPTIANVHTAHQALGAAILATAALLWIRLSALPWAEAVADRPVAIGALPAEGAA